MLASLPGMGEPVVFSPELALQGLSSDLALRQGEEEPGALGQVVGSACPVLGVEGCHLREGKWLEDGGGLGKISDS